MGVKDTNFRVRTLQARTAAQQTAKALQNAHVRTKGCHLWYDPLPEQSILTSHSLHVTGWKIQGEGMERGPTFLAETTRTPTSAWEAPEIMLGT